MSSPREVYYQEYYCEVIAAYLLGIKMSSPREVYYRLIPDDRKEVASMCFQWPKFDEAGEIACHHHISLVDKAGREWRWCQEEYYCEVIAAYLLMPEGVFEQEAWAAARRYIRKETTVLPVDQLAQLFLVEPWAVRFRIALME